MIKNLGLGFLAESKEAAEDFAQQILELGIPVPGYYGFPYVNYHIGDAQFILSTEYDPNIEAIVPAGFDCHGSGNSVWNVRIIADITPPESNKCAKRLLVERGGVGGGLSVVKVVNADVLPSFLSGETVRLQMIAFPFDISYYKDEEEYIASRENCVDEGCYLGDGAVIPVGFVKNHYIENNADKSNSEADKCTLVRGTVKKIYVGEHRDLKGELHDGYLRCIISTRFGELELVHTYEQVAETQRANIEVGSTVVAYVVLSGDAAILEYDHGFIRDEAHLLRLLRYVMKCGNAERLRCVLADDVVYVSETTGKEYRGIEDVINRIQYVHDTTGIEYLPHLAELMDSNTEDQSGMDYGAGKMCIVLATDEVDMCESLVFIDMDERNNISRIYVCTDSRYIFHINDLYLPEKKTTTENKSLVHIPIVDGHNGGSYFWIMPVKFSRETDTVPCDIQEFRDEEISIDEDTVAEFLYPFLDKYFDSSLEFHNSRDFCGNGFEWNLEHNLYCFSDVYKMVADIRKTIHLFKTDFDNPALDGLKSGIGVWLYMFEPEFGTKYKSDEKMRWEIIREHVDAIVNFYERFCIRMEQMMQNSKHYQFISFMGP